MKIAVLGDLILDHYIEGKSTRISPEAPIPVVQVSKEYYLLGGASNVARNLRSFGVDVAIFGSVGNDDVGTALCELLSRLSVDVEGIVFSSKPTIVKTRIIANNQQVVRIDKEDVGEESREIIEVAINKFKALCATLDVVVLSDYGKGFLTPYFLNQVLNIAKLNDIKVIVDPKGVDYKKYKNSTVLTPNKVEAELATGIMINSEISLKKALKALRKLTNSDMAVITLGAAGIAYEDNGIIEVFEALASEVVDVTGAGDTVISSLAFALGNGKTLRESVIFANKAASLVVKKFGSATLTPQEVSLIDSNSMFLGSDTNVKVRHFPSMAFTEDLKALAKRKVVFTNGVFDILHAGHVNYLTAARNLGDILIVGLNSDSSVRRLKGEGRPINGELNRAAVLSGLSVVDYVVIFEEDTPLNLIKEVSPSVLVKGSDYKVENIVGSEIVERTVTIPLTPELSSTELLKKVWEL